MRRPDHRRRRKNEWPAAVVVGLDNITGLQTARILADRGVRVYGVAANRRHFGARTNACIEVVESRLAGPELAGVAAHGKVFEAGPTGAATLVVMTTSSRCVRRARPRISSERPAKARSTSTFACHE